MATAKKAPAKKKAAAKKVKVSRPDQGVKSIPESEVERYITKGEWKVVD